MDARSNQSPARKLAWTIVIGLLLTIPLFSVWLLGDDRESQARTASESIVAGWGGRQVFDGPLLVIPYRAQATETVIENGRSVTRSREVIRELTIAPELSKIETRIMPERRKRSIYEAVVYEARTSGEARFSLPTDLDRSGVDPASLDLGRAQMSFGLSDPRGLGANPRVVAAGKPLSLLPGESPNGGTGFFAFVDATGLPDQPLAVVYDYAFRGNGSLGLQPAAGQTDWTVTSPWPHPSFVGDFLPARRTVGDAGFSAQYRIGNLALGRSLAQTSAPDGPPDRNAAPRGDIASPSAPGVAVAAAGVTLIQPVDLYSRVDRSAKYGFLFIGFTFLALLMFDVIGGARVSPVEYLLTGAALVLFFVLLLAFAEVIGFLAAYVVASAAIAGLITAYSAAVLKSWRRSWFIGAMLVALYVVLYVLLSLEAFSLLIGSILLFAALAGVMYTTRNVDWSAAGSEPK